MPKSKEKCKEMRDSMRARILKESALYFARNGFHNAKISDLAGHIGIGQGTIYVYFKSKEELYTAIMEQINNENDIRELKLLSKLPCSGKMKIKKMIESVISKLQEDEAYAVKVTLMTQFMMEESKYDSSNSLYQSDLYKCTAKIIKQGQGEGTVVSGDSTMLADMFWGVIYLYSLKKLFSKNYKMIDKTMLERILLVEGAG